MGRLGPMPSQVHSFMRLLRTPPPNHRSVPMRSRQPLSLGFTGRAFHLGRAQIDCVQTRCSDGEALSEGASPIEGTRFPAHRLSTPPQPPLPRISGAPTGLPHTLRRPPAPYDAKAGPLERRPRRDLQVLELEAVEVPSLIDVTSPPQTTLAPVSWSGLTLSSTKRESCVVLPQLRIHYERPKAPQGSHENPQISTALAKPRVSKPHALHPADLSSTIESHAPLTFVGLLGLRHCPPASRPWTTRRAS